MSSSPGFAVFSATECLFSCSGWAAGGPRENSRMGGSKGAYSRAVDGASGARATVIYADRCGPTPLMQPALYSNGACIRLLLDKGADPNAANQAGATALMWSAGDPEKIRLLLNKKAAVNPQASSGRTALSIAASIAGNIEGVQ